MTHVWRLAPLLCLLWLPPMASNVNAGPTPTSESVILLSVGDARVSLLEVQRRLQMVPPFQLATLGKSAAEIRENFVQRVLVPELLLSQEAVRRKLSQAPSVKQREKRLLVDTLETELRAEAKRRLTEAEVSRYFKEHRASLSRPKRLRLFRLLAADRPTAEKLLQQAKQFQDLTKWRALVREHSKDRATRLRAGDLGFVHPDGNTDVPRVRVSPELFAAAALVSDGQFVDTPIVEGRYFAVIWRRGSLEAVESTLEQEAPLVQRTLVEAKVQEGMQALFDKLSNGRVTYQNATLLGELDLKLPADPRLPASALLSPSAATGSGRPGAKPGETGLR